jgi:flavin-dependent dehydrogenase
VAKKYDVIVVGAGPAGFLAAKAAGENGLEVALLERKPDPTIMDRACLQTLISANEYFFRNLLRYNARDKRICFSSDGFSFKYDGPYINLYSLAAYTPNGHKIEHGDVKEQKGKGEHGRIGIGLDKEALFRNLLEEVKACSVEVFPGINVQKVTTTADGVRAEGSGQSFEGRYLIAADGVNSRVAEVMGFNKDRYYYCNLYALSYYLSGVEMPEPEQVSLVWAYGKEGAFRGYIMPRPIKGEYYLLLLTVDPRVNLEAGVDYFMTEAICAPWFKKAKKLKAFSAVCNCYSPIIEPYKDRVLVAGDVGATQELENNGAMVSGWKAGQAISTAVQEENLGLEVTGVSRYINWWKETYINPHCSELYMTGMSMAYILTTAEEMNYVYGLVKEPAAACWNPYTASNALRGSMAKAIAITQKERPDIFQKLERRSLPPRELLAEITKISKPVS